MYKFFAFLLTFSLLALSSPQLAIAEGGSSSSVPAGESSAPEPEGVDCDKLNDVPECPLRYLDGGCDWGSDIDDQAWAIFTGAEEFPSGPLGPALCDGYKDLLGALEDLEKDYINCPEYTQASDLQDYRELVENDCPEPTQSGGSSSSVPAN